MNTYTLFHTRNGNRSKSSDRQQEISQPYLIYATQLIEFRDAIDAIKEILFQEQIWPDQCDYVLYKIRPLQKAANSIANLANSTKKRSSKSSGYNHYLILVSAHYFCDQIDMLTSFIREYKEITDHKAAKKSKQIQIVNSLHHLDLSLHDLMKDLDSTLKSSQSVNI
jgi:hypothetical protein